MKKLLVPLLIALLAGCASPPPPPPVAAARPRPHAPKPVARPPATVLEIDRSYASKGQSSRAKFIIVHYTVSNLPSSIKALTRDVVSSHYLVTDERDPVVYGLVDETRQANHAGVSSWKNYTLINGSSIGIEIVNPGFVEGPNGRVYHPFPQAQIDKLILLIRDIAARNQIPPENVLGHSDIAPQRKQDPGPLFPWWQLARAGLAQWPDAGRVAAGRALYEQQLPGIRWFQQKLAAHGYAISQTGEIDEQTRVVISAFQMRFRPADFGGFPDAETAALLEAMNPTPPSAVPAAMPPAPPVQFWPAPVLRPPVAPAPVVPAPAPLVPAPAPVIPAPVAPAVPAPVVPAPVLPAPVAPAVPAPVVPAPVAPAVPAPVVPAPAIPAPLPVPVEAAPAPAAAPAPQPLADPAPARP